MASILELSFFDRRGQDPKRLQGLLLREIWGLDVSLSYRQAKMFLDHYDALSTGIDVSFFSPQTHMEVIEIVAFVKARQQMSLGDMKNEMVTASPSWLVKPSVEAAQNAINFAVSLWLMTTVKDWQDGETIHDLMNRIFPLSNNPVAQPGVDLDTDINFNAFSLCKIGGLDIIWTSRLNEHLRLNMKSREVYVFRHASLLSLNRGAASG